MQLYTSVQHCTWPLKVSAKPTEVAWSLSWNLAASGFPRKKTILRWNPGNIFLLFIVEMQHLSERNVSSNVNHPYQYLRTHFTAALIVNNIWKLFAWQSSIRRRVNCRDQWWGSCISLEWHVPWTRDAFNDVSFQLKIQSYLITFHVSELFLGKDILDFRVL